MLYDEIPVLTRIANYVSQTPVPGHTKPEERVSSDISETVMKVAPNFPGARLTGGGAVWPPLLTQKVIGHFGCNFT